MLPVLCALQAETEVFIEEMLGKIHGLVQGHDRMLQAVAAQLADLSVTVSVGGGDIACSACVTFIVRVRLVAVRCTRGCSERSARSPRACCCCCRCSRGYSPRQPRPDRPHRQRH